MSNLVVSANFDVSKISISVPRTLQSGAKSANFNYNGERLMMQTAQAMSLPFGLNVEDKFGPTQYSINLSFRGQDTRPEIKEFKKVIEAIDTFMIDEGVKNSQAWFKGKMSREVIQAFYTPTLKISKDKDGNDAGYPPNMKIKLRQQNNEFVTKFYDLKGKPYKDTPVSELLGKGVQITAIIECTGVWFAGSKYGLTWQAKQIAIHELPKKMGDFAFQGLAAAEDDDEDEKDMDEVAFHAPASSSSLLASVMPAAASAASSLPPPSHEEDAVPSVDDEQGDDMDPVPVPKKGVIKKKVITKKP